jgi:hypothetical protein
VITNIDVKAVLARSVQEFHSDLVTRSTGRAVRSGIETHLDEHPDVTVVVLDFSAVRVLDCSCADEVIAQLLLRHGAGSGARPTYFLLRGLDEAHADQIDDVLRRHGLALVAAERGGATRLLGWVTDLMRIAWERLESRGSADPQELASELAWTLDEARAALDELADLHLVMRSHERYLPLPAA